MTPKPGPSGACRIPSAKRSGGSIRSPRHGTSFHWYSRTSKFESPAQTLAEIIVPTGPLGLCGETSTSCSSATVAIRPSSATPPQCLTSGMITSTARSRQSGAKPSTPNRNSPPAIGWRMPSLIARVLSRSVGGTGSSYHDSACGSRRRATSTASGTSKLLWTSIFRSTSGPMAARIASMQAMPRSAAASISATGRSSAGNPSNGAALTARKPSATACRALAAKPAGVRSAVARLMLA